jgi:hypothetical protein
MRIKASNAVGLALAVVVAAALAAPAGASRTKSGTGLVTAKSVAQGSVTVDDTVFLVDAARTVIEDLEGHRIPLAKVPLRSDPPNSMNQSEPGAVAFEAVQTVRGWTLMRLTLIEAEPR